MLWVISDSSSFWWNVREVYWYPLSLWKIRYASRLAATVGSNISWLFLWFPIIISHRYAVTQIQNYPISGCSPCICSSLSASLRFSLSLLLSFRYNTLLWTHFPSCRAGGSGNGRFYSLSWLPGICWRSGSGLFLTFFSSDFLRSLSLVIVDFRFQNQIFHVQLLQLCYFCFRFCLSPKASTFSDLHFLSKSKPAGKIPYIFSSIIEIIVVFYAERDNRDSFAISCFTSFCHEHSSFCFRTFYIPAIVILKIPFLHSFKGRYFKTASKLRMVAFSRKIWQ